MSTRLPGRCSRPRRPSSGCRSSRRRRARRWPTPSSAQPPPRDAHDPRQARPGRRRGARVGGPAGGRGGGQGRGPAHLGDYLEQLEASLTANGATVHWARDAAEANRIVLDIVRAKEVDEVVKVKSMVTQEIELNEALEAAGIHAWETDLAELIVQLGHDRPSHILVPRSTATAARSARSSCARWPPSAAPPPTTSPTTRPGSPRPPGCTCARSSSAPRSVSRAPTSRSPTRAPSSSSSPRATAGCASRCPRRSSRSSASRRSYRRGRTSRRCSSCFPRSSTGERMNPYTTMWTGVHDGDGPPEVHVVLLDNGRSHVLADRVGRQALRCIRCSACLNVCPVYERTGGPRLRLGLSRSRSARCSTRSCGARRATSTSRCPMPRACAVRASTPARCGSTSPSCSSSCAGRSRSEGGRTAESAAMRGRGLGALRPATTDGAQKAAPPSPGDSSATGRSARVPGLGAWTNARDVPTPPKETFRAVVGPRTGLRGVDPMSARDEILARVRGRPPTSSPPRCARGELPRGRGDLLRAGRDPRAVRRERRRLPGAGAAGRARRNRRRHRVALREHGCGSVVVPGGLDEAWVGRPRGGRHGRPEGLPLPDLGRPRRHRRRRHRLRVGIATTGTIVLDHRRTRAAASSPSSRTPTSVSSAPTRSSTTCPSRCAGSDRRRATPAPYVDQRTQRDERHRARARRGRPRPAHPRRRPRAAEVMAEIDAAMTDSVTPLAFSTVSDDPIRQVLQGTQAAFIDLFGSHLDTVERILHVNATHSAAALHGVGDTLRYDRRMKAIEFAMDHDDGASLRNLAQSDLILVAPSRCGKTPTSMYLALQHGLKVANYPLVPEDFDTGDLPRPIAQFADKCFGLLSTPARLSQVRWFADVGIGDVASVGGKNASLGEMVRELSREGVRVPDGFATTADAYRDFLAATGLDRTIAELLAGLDTRDLAELQRRGLLVRQAMLSATLPRTRSSARSSPPTIASPTAVAAASMSRSAAARPPRICPMRASPASRRPSSTSAGTPRSSMRASAASRRCSPIARSRIAIDKGFDHAKPGRAVDRDPADGALRSRGRRRDVHDRHRVGVSRCRADQRVVRPRRERGAGLGEPRRVLRVQAAAEDRPATDPAQEPRRPRSGSWSTTPAAASW
jgi:L-lactate dehydrogenase complex protein LldF